MSIRTRLLLLVFAVWLPALAGFGLLARSTYLHETEVARQHLLDTAHSIGTAVDDELDARAAVARTLGSSRALREGDLERFYQHAQRATDGTVNTVILVDGERQVLNTLRPFGTPLAPEAWHGSRPLVEGAPQVTNLRDSAVDGRPVLTVVAPQPGVSPQRYNIGVAFSPAVIQHTLDRQKLPPGAVASVLDAEYRTIARSLDPAKWLGVRAAPDTVAFLRRGDPRDRPFTSATHEGQPTLAYAVPSGRYGWTVVVGLSRTALDKPAIRVTTQAFSAAGALAVIGLGLALYAARKIDRPVLALSRTDAASVAELRSWVLGMLAAHRAGSHVPQDPGPMAPHFHADEDGNGFLHTHEDGEAPHAHAADEAAHSHADHVRP